MAGLAARAVMRRAHAQEPRAHLYEDFMMCAEQARFHGNKRLHGVQIDLAHVPQVW